MPDMRELFYYLDSLINILFVDDDPQIITILTELFKPLIPYSVNTASTSKQAEKILASPKRIHLCVLDLGLNDIRNDEFYLLKKYADKVCFIIFTGSLSPAKGFEAHGLGAKAIFEKADIINQSKFVKTVNYYSLLNIINPKYKITEKDTLSLSTDILFKSSPQFVSKWAQQLGMTDRSLRHIWTKNLGANAKIILSIHAIFSMAFNYFERCEIENSEILGEKFLHTSSYRRLEEFFHIHKSTISDFIAYGDIAALV